MLRICLITCLLLVVHSCTVEKRLYRNGFHVEWKKHRASAETTVAQPVPESNIRIVNNADEEHSAKELTELNAPLAEVPGPAATATFDQPFTEQVEISADLPVLNEDSTKVEEVPYKRVVTEKELRNYQVLTTCIMVVLFGLLILCFLGALTAESLIELFALIVIGLILLVFAFIFLALRSVLRPDRVAEMENEKREYEQKERDGTLTEEEVNEKKFKKRKAIVFFSIFFGVIGAIILVIATTQ